MLIIDTTIDSKNKELVQGALAALFRMLLLMLLLMVILLDVLIET
jgi:hypothetical protein